MTNFKPSCRRCIAYISIYIIYIYNIYIYIYIYNIYILYIYIYIYIYILCQHHNRLIGHGVNDPRDKVWPAHGRSSFSTLSALSYVLKHNVKESVTLVSLPILHVHSLLATGENIASVTKAGRKWGRGGGGVCLYRYSGVAIIGK